MVGQLIEAIGVDKVIRYVPNEDPSAWAGKVLIIRGSIVIPKPVVTYKFEAF
jgi:hypothetical protein